MSRRQNIGAITKRNVELIARIEAATVSGRTFGQRVADLATKWVGSWTFLIVQTVLLILWIVVNAISWSKAWDPFPFILLNLVLSFQSAFATPIILMSQNRQARLDERRNQLDLQINLLAEQENTMQLKMLRMLCEKAGIKLSEPDEAILEQAIDPDRLVRQITAQVDADEAMPKH